RWLSTVRCLRLNTVVLADNVAEHRHIFTPAFAGRYVAQTVEDTLKAQFREVNFWSQSNLNLAGHLDNVPFLWPRRIIGLPMPSDERRGYPLPAVTWQQLNSDGRHACPPGHDPAPRQRPVVGGVRRPYTELGIIKALIPRRLH